MVAYSKIWMFGKTDHTNILRTENAKLIPTEQMCDLVEKLLQQPKFK